MMMRHLLSRLSPRARLLVAGTVLILATNAVILAGAAYNRSGNPEAVIRLSQRELQRPYGWGLERENSGLSLRLAWRVLGQADDTEGAPYAGAYYGGAAGWLDAAKLRELGFKIPATPPSEPVDRGAERLAEQPVLVVLELEGPAWQQALARARQHLASAEATHAASPDKTDLKQRLDQARDRLKREAHDDSRLFAIDAGLDRAALRAKYPDRSRYLIVQGNIRPYWDTLHGATRIAASVSGLGVVSIHVPRQYKNAFTAPGYTVDLAFGQRLEPWIIAAHAGK